MARHNEDLPRKKPSNIKKELHTILDIPLSNNHTHFIRGNGKVLKPEAKRYIKRNQMILAKDIKEQGWKIEDKVWIYADMYFYFPDLILRDNHNCVKLLADTLEGLVFYNDYFLMPRTQYVGLDRKNPRLELIVKPAWGEDK